MTKKMSGNVECPWPDWFDDLRGNIEATTDFDFARFAAVVGDDKWQFAGIMQGMIPGQERPTDLTCEEIIRRATQIGAEIAAEILNQKTSETANQGNFLDIICIMNGALPWCQDIEQTIATKFQKGADELTIRLHCIETTSYPEGKTESSGRVAINGLKNLPPDATNFLIVDDICDTGRTLLAVKERIAAMAPKDAIVKSCVMLDKPERRVAEIEPDFTGFVIENRFVVGYGMNYQRDDDRALPFVGFMTEKENSPAATSE